VRYGLLVFFASLLGLAVVRLLLGFVAVPVGLVLPVSLLVTALYIAVPVFAVFAAASHPWTVKLAVGFVVGGLLVHFGLWGLVHKGLLGQGVLAAIAGAISQTGFFLWCIGLGALLAVKLKDRNLLLPVSVFLAGFDIFTILTPIGPTQAIMKKAPEILPAVGLNIPRPQATPTMGPVAPLAFVGPADFLFMGMFFVAIYRFEMRPRETVKWLIPAILVYLLLSMWLGAIPLLVPIGLTVLIVNWREFRLNKEEKISTGVLAAIMVGLIAFGMTRQRPAPQAEPSQSEPVQSVETPEDSLGQGQEDRGPSESQSAPGNTPNPP
jgi:hypothetical protein